VCVGGSALAAATAAFTDPVQVLDQGGQADLVVAADPDHATLVASRRTLRAGGELYVEFHSPARARHLERIASDLESHGFDRVRVYWPWPPPFLGPVKFWIPLHPRSALEFFRSERSPAPPPILRAGGRLMLRAWSYAAARRIAWPLCAVATTGRAMAEEVGSGGPVPRWLATLAAAARTGRPDAWALQTLGPRSHSKVVGLPFDAAGEEPQSIVKLGRVPEAEEALRHEAAVLAGLPDSIAGVPRILYAGETAAGFAVAQTVMRGVPLWRFARDARSEPLALRVTAWTADLANATAGGPPDAGMAVADQAFERFLRGFAPVAPEALLAESRSRLQALRDCPSACEHRDLGPWNILIGPDGAPGVLDWESSEPQGLQGADLHYFLAYHAFFRIGAMRSGRHLDAYAALRGNGALADLRERCFRAYEDRTGLDPAFHGPLALYTWIVHAGAELSRLRRDAGGPPPARALRSSLFFRLWQWEASRVGDRSIAVPVDTHHSAPPAPPLVSLVICTRDRPDLLRDTVLSVLAGDTVPAELIIIDQSRAPNPDVSALRTDRCEVRYVPVRSTGLATARNTGIEAARHALIVFLDDDMRVEAGWLRAMVRAAVAAGPGAAITGQVRPEEPAPPGTFVPSTVTAVERRTYAGRQRHEVLSAGNAALWRDAFQEVGLFDRRLGAGTRYPSAEDNDLCFRLFEAGYEVVYEPAAVVYHRAWRPLSVATRLRWDYGVGQGAYYAKHLTLRDRFFLRRLGRDVGLRLLRAPRHLLAEPRHAWREVVYAAAVAFGATGFLLRERRHPG
jgi:glycosyltransferase involved in cell wall biosynthesis